jgi:hypothetical protein
MDPRVLYRIASARAPESIVGNPVPVSKLWAFSGSADAVIDGRIDVVWRNGPQHRDQWIIADLGATRNISGVTHALGEYARDFPRRLVIDTSLDASQWEQVWEGPTAARAFLAAVQAPRTAAMAFAFRPRRARFVRLRQLGSHKNYWRVAELIVYGR